MKSLKCVILMVVGLFMVGCTGGSGNTSTGGIYFNHAQLAKEFVRRMNIDLIDYDVDLVKTHTEFQDYIVVKDYGILDSYGNPSIDAYYIGDYRPGQSLANYVIRNDYLFYFDLTPLGGNRYRAPAKTFNGYVYFSRATDQDKNTSLTQGMKDSAIIGSMAKKIMKAEFGLSSRQAVDISRFAYEYQTAPESYDMAHFDAFTTEIIGSSITEIYQDMATGKSLEPRLEKAKSTLGIGSEKVDHFVNKVILGM